MKAKYLYIILLIVPYATKAQEFSSYEKAVTVALYSQALQDSVKLEINLPKEFRGQKNKDYPIIYLLDKQLYNNYKYNLYTIDYLSTLQWMPKAIIVGINFTWKNRNSWTNPNATEGQADDFIIFLKDELNNELQKKYPISNFNLLIGHSRTAIFASYALSQSPDFFNGAIANSVSNFDFGDKHQQAQFEAFLKIIPSYPHKFYYYFSVGEQAYGDLHESAVDSLNTYLSTKKLPKNFEWKYYKHRVAHDITPGVSVSSALSEIFREYGKRMDACFELAKQSKNEVPWDDFLALYSSISSELGFKIEPEELFFNSIASEYYNDYDNIYGDKHLNFSLEILLKAIEKYPEDYDYYAWIGEIYLTLNEFQKGEDYLNKGVELINKNQSVSQLDRARFLQEIEALKK
jgi:enterochelin esterase-like enzyme